MPCNVYGINDNYDSENSHFLPALIRKIIEAKNKKKNFIKIWGNGRSLRELIYCDDVADACLFFLKQRTKESLINIGSGRDYTIKYYAKKIMQLLNVNFKLVYEKNKPNGTFRKLLNNDVAIKYGWKNKISLEKGLTLTINDYQSN